MELNYPTTDDIIKANKKVIELLRITKAERHHLLVPKDRIESMINTIESSEGNVKKKAAMFLREINRRHFFGSANKRTSFVVAADFLLANEGRIPLKKKDEVKFLIEIR